MSHFVKVAEIDEILPGKGKTIHLHGREVTVVNREGRFVAWGTWTRHAGGPAETACDMPGHRFDIGIGDSPDRLQADELHYQVRVDGRGVFVLVEEGHTYPGGEPRADR